MIKPRLLKPLLAALLLIALSIACNRSSDSQPTLVPTWDPNAGATGVPTIPQPNTPPGTTVVPATDSPTPPPPTPTPTATATPTPTPPPTVQLGQAEQHLANGNYEAAQAIYQSLPLDSLDPDQVVRDYLGYARSLLHTQDPAGAINILRDLLARYPNHASAPEAHFMLAEALIAIQDYQAAIEQYNAYLAWYADPEQNQQADIAAYVHRWIGDAYLNGGEYDQAIQAYQQAISLATVPVKSDFTLLTREKIALAHNYAGDHASALTQYDLILALTQDASLRARIQYQAAQTLLMAGEPEAAYTRYYNLIANYPASPAAYEALVDLINDGQPVDDFQRGLVDYYADAYDPAVAAFYRAIEADPQHGGAPHYYAALTYRNAGNYRAALSEFDTLIETHPQDRYWDDAWVAKAWTHYLAGDNDAAVETYTRFVDEAPTNGLAPEALWWAANIHYWEDENLAAAELFSRLQNDYPSSEYAPDALYRAGICHYRLGEHIQAAADWEGYAGRYPQADLVAGSHFWRGRAYLTAGQALTGTAILSGTQLLLTTTLPLTDTGLELSPTLPLTLTSTDLVFSASLAFKEAIAAGPLDYYSLRAADYLTDERAPLPGGPYDLDYDEAQERAETEAWLANWLGLRDQAAQDVGQLSPTLAADGRLRRGREMWQLGHQAEGKEELESLRRNTASDALTQYQLALLFRDLGLYRSSILAANAVIRLSPARSALDAPSFLARLAYPTYYADLVLPEAEAKGLDPLLVFALIRQESLFEGFATSYAYAYGLMQIIPSTGQSIANSLAWANYQTDDLYRPFISVKFGTWYLAQQVDTFEGQLYPALAAYNAGPGNAHRWLSRTLADCEKEADDPGQCSLDHALFVELMNLREPRLYVRLISEHHAVYRHLYGR